MIDLEPDRLTQCRSLHFLSLIVSDSRFAARNVDAEAIGRRLHSHSRVSQDDQLSLRPRTPGAQSTTQTKTNDIIFLHFWKWDRRECDHVMPCQKCYLFSLSIPPVHWKSSSISISILLGNSWKLPWNSWKLSKNKNDIGSPPRVHCSNSISIEPQSTYVFQKRRKRVGTPLLVWCSYFYTRKWKWKWNWSSNEPKQNWSPKMEMEMEM